MGTRRVRALKRWMKAEGIECSDALELTDGKGEGMGVRALCELKEGDVVARIPKLTCLTIRTTGCARELNEGGGGLAVALMYERSLGERSRWAPYLSAVAEVGEESLPLLWRAEEVERLLQGTELEACVKEDRADCVREWNQTILPLLHKLSLSTTCTITSRHCFFTFQHFLAAKTLISSRSFQIDHYHGVGMVPLADLFNHKTGAEDVHLMTSPSPSPPHTEPHPNQANNESSALNSTSTSISTTTSTDDDDEYIISASSNTDDDDDDDVDDDDDLEMIMVKDVKRGAEVFNTYGLLGNAALLHRYGFTEPDNPYDIVNIDLELVLQWCSTLFSGQHRRARLSLWRRLDYSGCVSHNSEYFEISFHGEPQIDLLSLLYIMLLPHDAYYKMDLALATAGSFNEPMDIIFSDKSKILCGKTAGLSKDLLLTKTVSNALLSLADMRESLYGTNSIEDDIEALGRLCCIREKKLYHSLMLRISEKRIIQKLRIYAAASPQYKTVKQASVRKKLKRK